MTPTARKLNARAEMADDDGDHARAEMFAEDALAVREIENEALLDVAETLKVMGIAGTDPGVALEEIGRTAAEAIARIRGG